MTQRGPQTGHLSHSCRFLGHSLPSPSRYQRIQWLCLGWQSLPPLHPWWLPFFPSPSYPFGAVWLVSCLEEEMIKFQWLLAISRWLTYIAHKYIAYYIHTYHICFGVWSGRVFHTYTHTYIYVYVYIYVCICIHVYIFMYVLIYFIYQCFSIYVYIHCYTYK